MALLLLLIQNSLLMIPRWQKCKLLIQPSTKNGKKEHISTDNDKKQVEAGDENSLMKR